MIEHQKILPPLQRVTTRSIITNAWGTSLFYGYEANSVLMWLRERSSLSLRDV